MKKVTFKVLKSYYTKDEKSFKIQQMYLFAYNVMLSVI